jgi:hypothetical protein
VGCAVFPQHGVSEVAVQDTSGTTELAGDARLSQHYEMRRLSSHSARKRLPESRRTKKNHRGCGWIRGSWMGCDVEGG